MNSKPEPGSILEQILAEKARSSEERALLLAHLEKVNRKAGDLEALREIKAYKARLNQSAVRSRG